VEDPYTNMPNCNDCRQVFASLYDLSRHAKLRCAEDKSLKRKREDNDDDDDDDDRDDDEEVNNEWIDYASD
jgi:hypothetical protein